MRLVEIRHLEGPNIFLSQPAIKLELQLDESDHGVNAREARAQILEGLAPGARVSPNGDDATEDVAAAAQALVNSVHRTLGLPEPTTTWRRLELPGHLAIAFTWERRSVGRAIARLVGDVLVDPAAFYEAESRASRGVFEDRLAEITALLAQPHDVEDLPELIQRQAGQARIVAVTGTNGKTTTTRLISKILRHAGQSVGWTSTSGVYVNGSEIESGDWSGPAGAHLLLERDDLDWAILETARGGILRRGLAFSEADVTVFINISDDHLGDYGVLTVEGLADVKAVVPRATAPHGLAVLNADDPLVMRALPSIKAPVCLVTQDADNPAVMEHERAGRTAVIAADGVLWLSQGGHREALGDLRNIPITFAGRATHMVENVICAVGAAIGCGIPSDQIVPALASFGKSLNDNPGRLNAYDVNGVLVLVDYAHNEAGLSHLIRLATSLVKSGSQLWTVIGTAGDRSDQVFRALGRIAAESSDRVIAKDSLRYLRGRQPGTMQQLMLEGVAMVDSSKGLDATDEIAAVGRALEETRPGDVVAMMASDMPNDVRAYLEGIGKPAMFTDA